MLCIFKINGLINVYNWYIFIYLEIRKETQNNLITIFLK